MQGDQTLTSSADLVARLIRQWRSIDGFLTGPGAPSDDIVTAQVTETSGQLARVAPLVLGIVALLWGMYGSGEGAALLAAGCLANILLSGVSLFALPHGRRSRVHYATRRGKQLALAAYACASAIAWSAMLAGAAWRADPGHDMFLMCFFVGTMCTGGMMMMMVPRAMILFLGIMALAFEAVLWLHQPALPPVFLIGVVVMALMLGHAFLAQAMLFVAQHDAARRLADAERERSRLALRESEDRAAADLAAERAAMDQRIELAARRNQEMQALAGRFEQSVLAIVETLADAVKRLDMTTGELARIGSDTRNRAATVARRAASSVEAAQSVAAATHQLTLSVSEISARLDEQVAAARAASDHSHSGRSAMHELAVKADAISDIARMIESIAANSNLLALNATIEAARAGEAGRGFAVVAHEVKTLSGQTQNAIASVGATASDIAQRMDQAVTGAEAIAAQIAIVSEGAGHIASSIAQQKSAAAEIGSSAAHAASAAGDMRAEIQSVAGAAETTGALAEEMRAIIAALSGQSATLKSASTAFLDQLRAA